MPRMTLQRALRTAICAAVVPVLAVVGATAARAAKEARGFTVVSGIVRVATTDNKGNVESIEIMVGEDDQEPDPYLVADTPNGQKLKEHVGEYVFAAGDVTEDKLGWKTIAVKKFTLSTDLKEPEDP